MIETDEYRSLEILDASTYEFAEKSTDRFKKRYGKASSSVGSELRKFTDTPVTIQASISGDHDARLYKETGLYKLVVDGNLLASTSKLITWFSVSDDFSRVAYFETDGSDEGILYIMKNGSIQEKHYGFFHQVLFFQDGYYAVQAFRGKDIPEGVPLNAQRIILDGNIVWGKEVSEVEFISLSRFGEECLVAVGNWMKARIYRGNLSDPATWKQVASMNHPAFPIAIRDGMVYLLEYTGYGAITRDGETIARLDNPVEEFSGYVEPAMMIGDRLLVFTLKDAKLQPVVYDINGNKQANLPVYEYSALAASCHDEKRGVLHLTSMGRPEIVYSYSD